MLNQSLLFYRPENPLNLQLFHSFRQIAHLKLQMGNYDHCALKNGAIENEETEEPVHLTLCSNRLLTNVWNEKMYEVDI